MSSSRFVALAALALLAVASLWLAWDKAPAVAPGSRGERWIAAKTAKALKRDESAIAAKTTKALKRDEPVKTNDSTPRWTNGPDCNVYPADMDALEQKQRDTPCLERALRGDNVLMERVLQFARDWDRERPRAKRPFLCDFIVEPGRYMGDIAQFWPPPDEWTYMFDRHTNFSWDDIRPKSPLPPGRALLLVFRYTGTYCNLFDLVKFRRSGDFPVVIVGPWGDKENFSPFSAGKYSPYFGYEKIERTWKGQKCMGQPWSQVIEFLESHRVRGYISFQQNIEHPKVISLALGVSQQFHYFAIHKQGLNMTMNSRKDHLIGVTFTPGWGHRTEFLVALNASAKLRPRATFSTVNPFSRRSGCPFGKSGRSR
jgi:hypothetical protein